MIDTDVCYADVKPNNILVECKLSGHGQRQVSVDHVQIADVEDACHVPPGRTIRGTQIGNWMWRSPEAHAQGPLGKPSDMFSFGLVVSF
jgi:serine/threonine protein kinase